MKRASFYWAALLLLSACFFEREVAAQEVSFEGVKLKKLDAMGRVPDTGYYIFYETDKGKKGMREYSLTVHNENLEKVFDKTVEVHKNYTLDQTVFNGKYLLLAFLHEKKAERLFMTYDMKGNEAGRKQISNLKTTEYQMGYSVFGADNYGFYYVSQIKEKKWGVKVDFFTNNLSVKWTFKDIPDKGIIKVEGIIATGKSLTMLVMDRERLTSRNFDYILMNLEQETGKKRYAFNMSELKNPAIISAIYLDADSDKLLVMGDYLADPTADKKRFKDSDGVYILQIDNKNGRQEQFYKYSWADVGKKVKDKLDVRFDKPQIIVHDVVKAPTGNYYIIGETYKRVADAAGIAARTLMMASGGNVQTDAGVTKINVMDFVILNFNADFQLTEVIRSKKTKSGHNVPDLAGGYVLAQYLKSIGGFDFVETVRDWEKGRFTIMYINRDKEGERPRQIVGAISIYLDGEISEKKITLSRRGEDTGAYTAKPGYVMIYSYQRKEKLMTWKLEPLDK